MKVYLFPILLLLMGPAYADTFGSGANTFTMNFVTIGNAGNTDDTTGYGSVGYNYHMGVNEVSRGMINAYNALSGGPSLTMTDMSSFGGNGVNRPATGMSWNEAARFVNWLNDEAGYGPAYKFTTGGFNDNIALWNPGDAGYNAANQYRNTNAHYYLPSEDEWYKAAFYDPTANSGAGGYWDYATGSNTAPTAVNSGTTSGTAVYNRPLNTGPADITNAGGLSPYGTMAQNGNVWELGESAFDGSNNVVSENRVNLGGVWHRDTDRFIATTNHFSSNTAPTTDPILDVGFRVAAIPEPSAFFLALLGMISVVTRRRRL